MAFIQTVRGFAPHIGEDCFIAENATIVGQVTLGDYCSIWFNAVLRGDVNEIRIGNYTNIQDGAIIHCTYQKAPTTIGNHVSVGHGAIVHGCTIEDRALVGMGAIVMDQAIVRTGTIIAAGAVILEHTETEAGWLYAGVPARKIKPVDETLKHKIATIATNYKTYAKWFAPQHTE